MFGRRPNESASDAKVVIGDVEAADYEAIVEISRQIQDLHRRWMPDVFGPFDAVGTKARLQQRAGGDARIILVARQEGAVVGVVQASIVDFMGSDTSLPSRYARIEAIGVRQEHRRRGIGTALLKALRDRLRQKSVDKVQAHHYVVNDASRAMFDKAGFASLAVVRELRL
jgi:ribosomal protein S18 acetylase RimI-like enzyme